MRFVVDNLQLVERAFLPQVVQFQGNYEIVITYVFSSFLSAAYSSHLPLLYCPPRSLSVKTSPIFVISHSIAPMSHGSSLQRVSSNLVSFTFLVSLGFMLMSKNLGLGIKNKNETLVFCGLGYLSQYGVFQFYPFCLKISLFPFSHS